MNITRKGLEKTSDRIEMEFSKRKIEARITGGVVTPRAVVFNLSKSLPGGNGLGAEMATALGVPAVVIEGKTITVKRKDAVTVSLLTMLGKLEKFHGIPPFAATLGMCDDGAPLLVRLPSVDVGHVLVSGAGASDLLRTIAVSLAVCNKPRDMRLVLVGRGFSDLRRLPHVQTYTVLNSEVCREMDHLGRLLGREKVSPRVVIVIDELGDEMHDKNFARILQDGHAVGIHVVASGSSSSAGFTTRIQSADEPRDFIARAAGQEVRFTAAYVSPAEVIQVVIGALPKREPSRLQQAVQLSAGAK